MTLAWLRCADAVGEPEAGHYEIVSTQTSAGMLAAAPFPWDAFWDSYFAWELEPVDDSVRIRTDLAAVSEDTPTDRRTTFMGCSRGCGARSCWSGQQAHGTRRRSGGLAG